MPGGLRRSAGIFSPGRGTRALQHHEKSDGSGHPYGIPKELISIESHVISICDVYDNLISGKGPIRIKDSRDAIKYLLEVGTKHFKSDVLYTFIHMTNYNEIAPETANF